MNPWTRTVCMSTLAALTGACAAQDSKPAAPPAGEKQGPADSRPAEPNWPAFKSKNLYANDFRGKKAPEFYVQKFLTPEPDRRGKVVLIDFWATWCGPCREAIPEINALQAKFKDDLVCIGISDEPASKVEQFSKKTPLKYTSAIDPTKRMSKAVGVGGIPHVLIISTDGIVRWQGFPLMDEDRLTEAVVQQIIDADPGVRARHEKEAAKDKSKGKAKSGDADKPAPAPPAGDTPEQPKSPGL
jgi:cytochrome c biogenesis protein CcmG/thiol:disulfide interchange protein DsbE